MTVKDLLDALDIQAFMSNLDNTLELKLKIEYIKTSAFPYDHQEFDEEENVTAINVDLKNNTITFKGENK